MMATIPPIIKIPIHIKRLLRKNHISDRYIFQMYLGYFTRSIYSCNLDTFRCILYCRVIIYILSFIFTFTRFY